MIDQDYSSELKKSPYEPISKVSGFYYDEQMRNPFLSIGLYPNTELNGKEPDGWGPVDNPDPDSAPAKYQYRTKPLCEAIISQDFNVSISNSFTDFGGDPIGQLWNQNRAMAPYASEFAKILGKMTEKGKEFASSQSSNDGGWGAGWANFLTKITEKLGEGFGKNAELLSKALVVQGTRFSYYSDTNVSFGSNFGLRFTILPSFGTKSAKVDGSYTGRKEFVSVYKQVEDIIPYVIGDFIPVDKTGLGATVDEFIKKVASWQLPPAGFRADLKDVDNVQRGTMKLRIGPYFAIENLVIENAQFNFSKTMVKNPNISTISDPERYTPAYCEVSLVLRPATKFSKNSLKRFIDGSATKNYRTAVANKMNSSYSKLESEYGQLEGKNGKAEVENSKSDAEEL